MKPVQPNSFNIMGPCGVAHTVGLSFHIIVGASSKCTLWIIHPRLYAFCSKKKHQTSLDRTANTSLVRSGMLASAQSCSYIFVALRMSNQAWSASYMAPSSSKEYLKDKESEQKKMISAKCSGFLLVQVYRTANFLYIFT